MVDESMVTGESRVLVAVNALLRLRLPAAPTVPEPRTATAPEPHPVTR